MAGSSRKAISPWVVLVIIALALTASAFAGTYHEGSHLSCSQCHAMHGSYNGATYNGGAGFETLLKGEINGICIGCHSSSSRDLLATGTAAAPDDVIAVAHTSKYKNSGGWFQTDWATVDSPVAHDLTPGNKTAVQGTWESGAEGMKCIDCHEPHGSHNYRNMVEHPGGVGSAIEVREGTEVFVDPAATGWAQLKDTDRVGFADNNNVAEWCAGCHTNITTGNKHPQDAALSLPGVDGPHWVAGTGNGFDANVGDATPGIPRIRFGQAGADYASVKTVATTNTVMCLSCHKAHGSKYDSNLLWPYYIDGAADRTSGCAQCHDGP